MSAILLPTRTADIAQERPILFQDGMVRAIRRDVRPKTQTRRKMKKLPRYDAPTNRWHFGNFVRDTEREAWAIAPIYCPYGVPGDRLWVRETWGLYDPDGTGADVEHKVPSTTFVRDDETVQAYWRRRVAFRADWKDPLYGNGPDKPKRWRPSIHLPRWLARTILEVVATRTERLQDISHEDALAEGIVQLADGGYGLLDGRHYHHTDPRQSYFSLWEAINGPGSVAENPHVWVLTFRRIDQ